MERIHSNEELMKHILTMDSENSVSQFIIPGKGKFTLVLLEEEHQSISDEIEANPSLKRMINESRQQYKDAQGMSAEELIKSMSKKDFE